MGRIIYIFGGAKSGKSTMALSLAKEIKGAVAFIATAEAKDREMKKRIMAHKASRPKNWLTLEEPIDIDRALSKIDPQTRTVIVDCITLWITNLMMRKKNQRYIEDKTRTVIDICKKIRARCIFISNEVGSGIVPSNKLSREFRDIAGRINQMIADASSEAYFMVSGLPMRIK
ncbi:MAG TPA: bifunctional adenosylcobinamide kinase/adenosylcobinamide-phosphate guanylyltransferase [Candidatus Omnitrophota bacterium]|nr:bifunctional adenosylcobinamide kinase/adenosylcobinamide-phosphate guanylyltransferase [Candidatus Omnitrophota bacterium]